MVWEKAKETKKDGLGPQGGCDIWQEATYNTYTCMSLGNRVDRLYTYTYLVVSIDMYSCIRLSSGTLELIRLEKKLTKSFELSYTIELKDGARSLSGCFASNIVGDMGNPKFGRFGSKWHNL